jgi:hypothetical protein
MGWEKLKGVTDIYPEKCGININTIKFICTYRDVKTAEHNVYSMEVLHKIKFKEFL